jgi:hypothetical protein
MPTSTPRSGTDLPDAVIDALADIEGRLPADAPADDPAHRALAGQVAEYLDRRVHDPLIRALLARPGILAYCVRTAVQAEPGQGGFGSVSVRRSPPLDANGEPPDAPEPSAGPARRSPKGGKS